jgi:uncharacterized protein GlcG (DUF336 family)
MKKSLCQVVVVLLFLCPLGAQAEDGSAGERCAIPAATVSLLQSQLSLVTHYADANGGIFGRLLPGPNRSWSAIVDRRGVLCSVINSGNDPFPASRGIAIAKASTANGFSNSGLALSTAMLYASAQPGGWGYGLNSTNPFNPDFDAPGSGIGRVPGGTVTFGGGVALYSNGQVIGGLGVSGDTACADHAVAFRMRHLAGLDGTPGGAGSDNIQYASGPTPKGFEHPHCLPTDITP